MKLPIFILWLLPWGLIAITVALFGNPVAGAVIGIVSLVGVLMVLALAQAAKGN